MPLTLVNVGSVAGDGTGDKGQVPFQKVNAGLTAINVLNGGVSGSGAVLVGQGSNLISYTPPGSGAVVGTVQSKLQQTVNVLDFGADPTGLTDSTAAFAAANTFAGSGGSISIPKGNFLVSSISLSPGVSMFGAGLTSTKIIGSGTTGTLIQIGTGVVENFTEIGGFSVSYSSVQTSGFAISTTNCNGLYIRDIFINAPWVGIDLNGGASQDFVVIDNIRITNALSNGIQVGRTASISDLLISKAVIFQCVASAIQLLAVDGFYFDYVNISNCNFGIETFASSGQVVTVGLLNQVLSDGCATAGFGFLTNGGELSDTTCTNCWSSSNGTLAGGSTSATGVTINPGSGVIDGVHWHGGRIVNNEGSGISIAGGQRIHISEPQIYCNNQSNGGFSGIDVSSNVSTFKVIGGYIGLGGHINVVTGTNHQLFGIKIAAGSSNFYEIIGVNVQNNASGGISDGGTGTTKTISNNLGNVPNSPVTVTVGASPFTFTNNFGAPVLLQITGGTVSTVQIGNTAIANTNQDRVVPHGQVAVVTYSSVPNIDYFPL